MITYSGEWKDTLMAPSKQTCKLGAASEHCSANTIQQIQASGSQNSKY
jgi:hypothetical protein